jgi:hypothetical protein
MKELTNVLKAPTGPLRPSQLYINKFFQNGRIELLCRIQRRKRGGGRLGVDSEEEMSGQGTIYGGSGGPNSSYEEDSEGPESREEEMANLHKMITEIQTQYSLVPTNNI